MRSRSTRSTTYAIVLIGAALTASACGDSGPAAEVPPATVTVTAPAEPTQQSEPPEESAAEPKPVKQKQPVTVDSWVMPNVVGKVLQTAQDTIQAVTGNPFFYTESEDAAGLSRFQVLDANWKVCGQKPQPGARFNEDTIVTFAAVKLEESCP